MNPTATLTAQLEVRVIEFNAIVKVIRSRKFKDYDRTDLDMYCTRFEVYETRQFDLLKEIEALKVALGGNVTLWEGIFK